MLNTENNEIKYKIAVIGVEPESVISGKLIDMIAHRELEIDNCVKHFVALSQSFDRQATYIRYGISTCSLEEAVEAYKEGGTTEMVVPYGVCQYLIPILICDGVLPKDIYCVPEELMGLDKFDDICMKDVMLPFMQCGYLHKHFEKPVDTTQRFLPPKPARCRICGKEGVFNTYLARELMQDKKEEFEYFLCPECLCLQIASVPENLGDYYGEGYYSFGVEDSPDRVYEVPVNNMTKILDVGCGSGAWLLQKAMEGFGDLHGVDPFLESEIHHGDRVTIKNCSIHDLEGEGIYDYIRFSDSFEHVTDPHEVISSAKRLLKEDGTIELILPTFPNIAFDIFGPSWFQLDAPRHISLHSIKSLNYIAKKQGMHIAAYKYESYNSQFLRSYMYKHDVSFYEGDKLFNKVFAESDLEILNYISAEADKRNMGDHLTVWLKKE